MKNEFKKPLNLLILLGFISQGFSWGNYFMPIFYCGVWLFALRFRKERQFISQSIELFIFFISLIFSIKFIGHNSYTRLLAMGNALFVLQAMRLMWPLDKRNKKLAVMIAVTHIAVGSQFIVDYSFILVLVASIVLIPKSLFLIESEGFQGVAAPRSFGRGKIVYPTITIVMILFFLIFPRKKFISGKEAGMIMTEGPMTAKMDTVSGGSSLSSRAVLRIKGESIDYLKSFALDTFDGDFWTASPGSSRLASTFSLKDLKKCKYREVRVMDLTYIGSALPIDGYVANLNGNFFRGAIGLSEQGNVAVSMLWPQSINTYEYWTLPDKQITLSDKELTRYTKHPPQSAKLKKWLENLVQSETGLEKIGNMIEVNFRKFFKYTLGVPDLKRSAPVEDFIFNQKEGHCERYASALALLLRMKNIPARVVIGYRVPPPNQFADFHNVQAKDAHAWVEAYIQPLTKWVLFDGTPGGGRSAVAPDRGFAYTIKDWIEYVWYSKIVEFSPGDQQGILSGARDIVKSMIGFFKRELGWVVPLILIIFVTVMFYKLRFHFSLFKFRRRKKLARQLEIAESFYGELLKILFKSGFRRKPSQTPLEFLASLRNKNLNCFKDVELITECFCLVKYAEKPLNPAKLADAEEALQRIKILCS